MSRWRERWRARPRRVRWPVQLLVWAVVLRLLLALALPLALGWVARGKGFDVDWASLSLSLHTGELELRGLALRPRVAAGPPAAPWLTLERLHADLALGSLLSGGLRLQRLEIEGLELELERRADGSIPWLEHFAAPPGPPPPAEAPQAIELALPLAIDHLRGHQLALHLCDGAVAGGCDARFVLELRGEDLGHPGREGRLQAELASLGLLDQLALDLHEHAAGPEAAAELALALQGLHPGPLAGYLAPLGLAPDAHAIDARARLALELHPCAGDAQALAGRVELRELSVRRDGGEELALERVALAAQELGPGLACGLGLELQGLTVSARRDATGGFALAGLRTSHTLAVEPAAPAPAAVAPALMPRWSLAGLALRDVSLRLRDESFAAPTQLELALDSLAFGALDPQLPAQATVLEVHAHAPGCAAELALQASWTRAAGQHTLEWSAHGAGLGFGPLRPYLARAGLEPLAEPGPLEAAGRAQLTRADDGSWSGRAQLGPCSVGEPGARFALETAAIEGLRVDPAGGVLTLADADFDGLTAELGRDEQGRDFAWLLRRSTGTAGAALRFPLRIGGRLKDLALGGAGPAKPVRVWCWVESKGLVERAELAGELVRDAQGAHATLALEARGIEPDYPRALLAPLGVELEWQDPPRLVAKLDAQLAEGRIAAHVRELLFEEKSRRYFGAAEIGVEDLALDDPQANLGRIRARGLELTLARDAAGALHALGLKLGAQPASAGPGAGPALPLLPALGWSALDVEESSVHWSDAAEGRAVETTLVSTLHCGPLRSAEGAPPTSWRLGLRAQGLLDELGLEGELQLAPARIELRAALRARGFAPTLAGYLPPGLEVRAGTDELACRVHARAEARGAAGLSLGCELEGLRWGEGLALDRAALELPRLGADEIEIAELSCKGLRCRATRGADGSLALGCLRFAEVESAPANRKPAAPETKPPPLPRIALDKLELELASLEYRDESAGAPGEPLRLALALSIEKPLVLADAAPEALPPLEFVLRGTAEPLAQELELHARLEQWLVQPQFELEFAARGLRGAALTELQPALAARLDGSGLEQGELRGKLAGRLDLARRGVGRFDLARPFAAELTLEDLELRAGPGGEKLAGLERVQAEFERIDPQSGRVRAKSVEITRPFLRIERTSEGLRTCGLLLKPATGAAELPAPEPAATVPAADLSIGRLTANGLDFELVDRSTANAVRIPLSDLDLEVRELGTRALHEPLAIPFSGSLRAGVVALPPHGAQRESADRELFGECELGGRVQLYPEPSGWFRFGLDGLQLVNFRPLAAAQDVELEDGRLDVALRGRLAGQRGLSLESVALVSELELREGEHGPIQSALVLPSPTAAVLAIVRDLEGNLRLPVRVHVDPGGISKSEIVQAALASVSTIVLRALLSSPLRLAGALLPAGSAHAGPREEHQLSFDEGGTRSEGLPETVLLQLAGKLSSDDRLRIVLEHVFSAADLARAELLANPAASDCRELSQRLRLKKSELERARAELAARARVDLALGRAQEARAECSELRAIEAELGRSEDALDRVHELLRKGAERHAEQRRRAAARALANQRMANLFRQFVAAGIEPARIELRPVKFEPQAMGPGCVRAQLVRRD